MTSFLAEKNENIVFAIFLAMKVECCRSLVNMLIAASQLT